MHAQGAEHLVTNKIREAYPIACQLRCILGCSQKNRRFYKHNKSTMSISRNTEFMHPGNLKRLPDDVYFLIRKNGAGHKENSNEQLVARFLKLLRKMSLEEIKS